MVSWDTHRLVEQAIDMYTVYINGNGMGPAYGKGGEKLLGGGLDKLKKYATYPRNLQQDPLNGPLNLNIYKL